MIKRRLLMTSMPALALGACAANNTAVPPTGGTGTVPPPSLARIQAMGNATVAELPIILEDLQINGTLTGQKLADAQKAVQAAQDAWKPVAALTPANSANAAALISTFSAALQIVLSFIPETAPYAPLVGLLIAAAQAYVTQAPVAMSVKVSIGGR